MGGCCPGTDVYIDLGRLSTHMHLWPQSCMITTGPCVCFSIQHWAVWCNTIHIAMSTLPPSPSEIKIHHKPPVLDNMAMCSLRNMLQQNCVLFMEIDTPLQWFIYTGGHWYLLGLLCGHQEPHVDCLIIGKGPTDRNSWAGWGKEAHLSAPSLVRMGLWKRAAAAAQLFSPACAPEETGFGSA